MRNNNEYFNCLQIIFYIMKIIGIFPFIILRKGSWTWLLLSRIITVVSISIYFVALPAEILYIAQSINSMLHLFNFNFFVRIIPTITSRLFIILIPLITWNKSKNLHDYWNNWMYYQNEIEKIIGIPYSSPVKNKIRGILLAGILAISSATMVVRVRYTYHFMIHTNTSSIWYIMVLLHTIPLYWYANCIYVRSVTKTIIQLVQIYSFDGSEKKLHHLIRLWIALCDLNKQFNTSHSILFLGYLSFSIINIVASTYSSIFFFIFEPDKTISVTYFLNGSISILGIFVFCESANSVSRQISWKMIQTILSNNMVKLNGRLLPAISFFLQVIETRKPAIILDGFLTLDRSSIVSIYAAIINYLIILKQYSKT